MIVLERDEIEWLNQLRNKHMCSRYLFRVYDEKKIDAEEFIKRFRVTFEETGILLSDLEKRGL